MNTANNPQSQSGQTTQLQPIMQEVLEALDREALHMPIEQMQQELQLIVERLTFDNEHGARQLSADDIDLLIGGDVSSELQRFVEWTLRRGIIRLLVGTTGRLFLAFCLKHYRNVQEVYCTTPIELRPEFQASMLSQLRIRYPEPARIIFQTSPALLAGCSIDDGQRHTDMSLSSKLPKLVGEYVSAKRPLRRMPHGN